MISILCADTHCHLDDPQFADDLPAVLQRAADAGIDPIIAPGESLESNRRILEIAAAHPAVRPCVGVHPHRASTFDIAQRSLYEDMAARPDVVGIGEVGLDYYYGHSPRDKQIDTLGFFFDLAVRHKKPACIHVRDREGETTAVTDVLSLIRTQAGRLRGVIHCFTGTSEQATAYLDQGLFLSFTGIVTFKSADSLRDLLTHIPKDRILLETDSPYLAPVPFRGKRNEPAFLPLIFETTAAAVRLDPAAWSDQLKQNQQDLFGI